MNKKLTLLNPHWQGGADVKTAEGIDEIEKLYFKDKDYEKIEISKSEEDLEIKNNIIGYSIIKKQLEEALNKIEEIKPDKIFTIGGSCDADIPSLSYLNDIYKGNLSVLWFDAHGDINAANESKTHLFYGMPVRFLMKDADDELQQIVKTPLSHDKFINLGGRDFDVAEKNYITKNNIKVISVKELKDNKKELENFIKSINTNTYIHIDLDILEPNEYSNTALPVPEGIDFDSVYSAFNKIKEYTNVVGMGLYEYTPCEKKVELVEKLINFGLSI